jgi:hypothetical protein
MYMQGELTDENWGVGQIRIEESDFVFSAGEVLNIIVESHKRNTEIGIRAPAVFDGVLVTGIENIILNDESDPIILLRKYDSNGKFLERDKIKLSEIECVYAFKSSFKNPFLKLFGNVSRFYIKKTKT